MKSKKEIKDRIEVLRDMRGFIDEEIENARSDEDRERSMRAASCYSQQIWELEWVMSDVQ